MRVARTILDPNRNQIDAVNGNLSSHRPEQSRLGLGQKQ